MPRIAVVDDQPEYAASSCAALIDQYSREKQLYGW